MTAFQLAWPAFAYSIRDDTAAQAHLRLRPHLPALRHLLDVARARRARAVDRPSARPERHTSRRSAEAVPLLCFATAAYSGYSVLAIGIGRMRQTQLNWVVTGIGGARQHRAQLRADPAATG